MRAFWVAATVAAFGLFTSAAAAQRMVVVELFTSQGCSSCPPADALLGELAARDDVLPLGLHVDYWDYIGWKDSFADPKYTDRQRAYARAAGSKSIYTPQMIVGGKDHVVGYKPMKLAMLIDEHRAKKSPVDADVVRNGSEFSVRLSASGSVGASDILLVRYTPSETVKVRRGENAGKTLTYHNIVSEMSKVGSWNGKGTFSVSVPASDHRMAVIVQKRNTGPILGAFRLN